VFFAENYFKIENFQTGNEYLKLFAKDIAGNAIIPLVLDLPGIYQLKNIITVLKSIDVLQGKGWNLTSQHVQTSLHNVKKLTGLHGRWEVLQTAPTVVLEVAHNEDGIKQMVHHIKQLSYNKLHIIFGVVKDKEVNKVLELLPPQASYYFTQAHIPRALDKTLLQQQARSFGLNGPVFENVNLALENVLGKATTDDLIIVCGSIFLVAEVENKFRKVSHNS
jgi:dihydrofolate synthase/folylpolyglutamate synthase